MDENNGYLDASVFKNKQTLNDVLNVLECEEEDSDSEEVPVPEAIFIAPPEPSVLTDEDSADEDAAGGLDNLSSRQLLAEAEVRYQNPNHNKEPNFDGLVGKKKRTWVRGDLEPFLGPFPELECTNALKNLSAPELFELFIDDDIIDMFVSQSNQYALWKNCPNPNITAKETRCFLAILILSGYNPVANKMLYWSSQKDTRNELVYNCMRRNRFEEIMRFFHCVNNTEMNEHDKMWKLRPLMDEIKKRFMKYYMPEQNLSFDETMVKYYGKHSCKQFIRGKPIRFGYKLWSLCTVDGYLVSFEIYQGKSFKGNPQYEKHFGKAAAPLLTLLDEFEEGKKKLPYHLFFDNLFTSLNLLNYLRQQGYGATGTIRENRLQKCPKLTAKKQMKKKERGYYESAISKDDGVVVVKWMDNSIVSIASNNLGVQPISSVKRYSQKDKTSVQVPRPHLFGEYNRFMGGVDRMDENINMYRIHIRSKKWYWSLLTWMIDACVHNAWQLQRKTGTKIPQLEFRRQIVLHFLGKYSEAPKGGGRPSSSSLSQASRYDNVAHFVLKNVLDLTVRQNHQQ